MQEIYEAIKQISHLSFMKLGTITIILAIGFFARKQFSKLVIKLIQKMSADHEATYLQEDYVTPLVKPLSLIFIILALFLVNYVADLPQLLFNFNHNMLKSLAVFTFFWFVFALIKPLSQVHRGKKGGMGVEVREFLAKTGRLLVVIIGGLSILDFWGINVATFLAGLGLFGMAVALAAQDTIKNLFGCVAILMDKTFNKGDWIKTADVEGIVEDIGFRTTAIRQFDKGLVHIPNTRIADSAVINFSRMTHRRVRWDLGLTYDTTAQSLENIVKRIRECLMNHPGVESNPKRASMNVAVDDFADSSINILCSFFTKSTLLAEYLKTKEEILLSIRKIIQEEGAEFAFPTQSIHIESIKNSESPIISKPRKNSV